MTSPDTTALQAAIAPIAAYCARTPAPNAHADRCATLVNAAADYVEAVEQADYTRSIQPDWQALAYRIVAGIEIPGYQPTVLMQRCRALLRSPRTQARMALPLAQRMVLATITSHHLGLPDYLR